MGQMSSVHARTHETKNENSTSRIRKTETSQSVNSPADRILFLQKTIGNQAVQRLIKSGALQAKLAVNTPGGIQMKEADRMAEHAVSQPVQRQEKEEEELLQGKFTETIQRQEPEEEEPLQGKFTETIQRQEQEEEELLQGKFTETIQRQEPEEEDSMMEPHTQSCATCVEKANNTGMPDNLKAGIENLSGMAMDDVKVHYNSDKPARLHALAYTQGRDIHVGPRQERHLPHEAWHVVQQKQGRVKPTMQLKDGIPVNDDDGLEQEADVMGARALGVEGGVAQRVGGGGFGQKGVLNFLDAAQRKIHVKDGKKYDSVAEEIKALRLKAIVESPSVYLVKSQKDLNLMKQNQDAPVLAPRKHLIGEEHSTSQFTTAVSDWAWGAELLIEPYGSHKRLVDSKQDAKRKEPTGNEGEKTMWAQAKALEDTAAKALTNLANARNFGNKIKLMADKLQNPQVFKRTDTQDLKNICGVCWSKCNPALTAAIELARYLKDSTIQRGLGIFGSYFMEHALVKQTITETLINELGEGLENIKEQYDDQTAFHLSPNKITAMLNQVDALIPLLQRLVVAYDPKGYTLNDVERATREAIQNDDISKLSPLRERYMRQRIDTAGVPTLVKIGAEHVKNLRKNLPANTLAFDNYDAFQDKNTAKNVDV